jgi:hypothetical protein
MIRNWYARRMEAWENDLCSRATNRIVRPFDWGLDWIDRWPEMRTFPRNGHDPEQFLVELNEVILRDSDAFFHYSKPKIFHFDG